jgi:hypothetical protein
MIELINKFSTTLSDNNGSIMVNYSHGGGRSEHFNGPLTGDRSMTLTGYCEYRIMEVNNRFKQKAWILINTDMGDVIEYIHTNMPLSDDDLKDVNKLIRDHSLLRVQSITSRK